MRGDAASLSTTLVVVTVFVVLLTVALIAFAVVLRGRDFGIVAVVAAGLGVIAVWAFLRAPVAYDLVGDTLTVELRIGSKRFGPVASCRPLEEGMSYATRLWGNGGLFAVTGLYRDKVHGRFRAFVTDPNRLVLVRTVDDDKIMISPSNTSEWNYTR